MIAALASDSPWAPLLGLLPPELAPSLGPRLDRLATAVGPLRARARTGGGAPDGYDGLSLRGPYDRLVLSEWALADALPEEFLRRAARGEHAFYELARRDEARARTSVALFDPGPLQLGGPRVGQLLALLVLAGRARAAGASFGWATLQQPPERTDPGSGLRFGLDGPGLRSFLLGRTAFAPAPADLDRWLDRARVDDWEDLWIVGPTHTLAPGRRLAGVKTPVGRIEIAEVFEPGARALDVTVARGAWRRTLRVELPPEPECLQLLRGGAAPPPKPPPLERLGRTPGVARPVGAPVLLADGRKLAFLDAGRSVTVYTVPDAPSPKRGRYHRYALDEGDLLLGLGWTHRRLVLLAERAGELHVRDTHGDVLAPRSGARAFGDGASWTPAARPASPARVEVLAAPRDARPPALAFVDATRRLVALLPDRAMVLGERVLAATTLQGSLQVVVPEWTTLRDELAPGALRPHPRPADEARLGASAYTKLGVGWRSTVHPGRVWSVTQADGRVTSLPVDEGDEVIGLVAPPRASVLLGLLLLRADRRTVAWDDGAGAGAFFVADAPVRHAASTARGDRVALVLDDDRVEVWSLPAATCLLRVVAPP